MTILETDLSTQALFISRSQRFGGPVTPNMVKVVLGKADFDNLSASEGFAFASIIGEVLTDAIANLVQDIDPLKNTILRDYCYRAENDFLQGAVKKSFNYGSTLFLPDLIGDVKKDLA